MAPSQRWLLSIFLTLLPNLSFAMEYQNRPGEIIRPPIPLSNACKNFIGSLPEDYRFGWVESAEKAKDDHLPPVYVFYYHRPVANLTPTVFFTGGPGLPSWGLFDDLRDSDPPNMWSVFIDYRGVGCSSPYPKRENEMDYAQWGSVGIVRDSEAVRKAIGVKTWNLFGQSLGGVVVLRYIEKHPESIRNAVNNGGGVSTDYFSWLQKRFEYQLVVIQRFLEEFPQARQDIIKIVRENLCLKGVAKCGGDLVSKLANQYMLNSVSLKLLQNQLQIVATTGQPGSSQEEEPTEAASIQATATHISSIPDLGEGKFVDCHRVRELILRALGDENLFALSECWNSGASGVTDAIRKDFQDLFEKTGVHPIQLPVVRANLARYPELHLVFIGNQFDYYTPPSVLKETAGYLGADYFFMKSKMHTEYFGPTVFTVIAPHYPMSLPGTGVE